MTIDIEYLSSRMEYSPRSGILRWKPLAGSSREINRWNSRYAGKPAGCIHTDVRSNHYKNIEVKFCGKIYQAHHLAWLLYYGIQVPEGKQIDHHDGNATNNRIDNLRVVYQQENSKNKGRFRNNTSGATGVSWVEKTKSWLAWISNDKKQLHLGTFDTIFEAVCARKSAEITYGYHPRHGKVYTEVASNA